MKRRGDQGVLELKSLCAFLSPFNPPPHSCYPSPLSSFLPPEIDPSEIQTWHKAFVCESECVCFGEIQSF